MREFKIGDRVRVARKIPTGDPRDVFDCGWSAPNKDATVGKTGTVAAITPRGNVEIDFDDGSMPWPAERDLMRYVYPPAALEPAEYGNEEE